MRASFSNSIPPILAMLLAALTAGAKAQTVTWPTATAPCNGTLQACIDAQPAGAEVRIDSNAPTNLAPPAVTEIRLTRSLRLVAAPGRRPVFPDGFNIRLEVANGFFDQPTRIQGLTLRNGGQVIVVDVDNTLGIAPITLHRMRFEHVSGDPRSLAVFKQENGSLEVVVERSEFIGLASGGLIVADALAGNVTLRVEESVLVSQAPSIYAIEMAAENAGRILLVANANYMLGSYALGAIHLLDLGGSGARQLLALIVNNLIQGPASAASGIGIAGSLGEAPMQIYAVNNSLHRLGRAISVALRTPAPSSPGAVTGVLANNLIVDNSIGVALAPAAASLTNRNNLLHGNGSSPGFTPGPGTVQLAPRISPLGLPWLEPDSPAIDAGARIASLGLPVLGPTLDIAGHRRERGAAPDIGAAEFGDDHFAASATPGRTSANYFQIDHPATNGQPFAPLLATPTTLNGVSNNRAFGVYWQASMSRMALFNQDLAPMPLGARYAVFVPSADPPSPLWTANLLLRGDSPPQPTLDLPNEFDGKSNWIVLVTQNWNPQQPPISAGIYNNARITLRYELDRWRIVRLDAAPIPAGAAFNVYAQPPSANAFQFPVGGRSGFAEIDHPQLNGRPCAVFQVTPVFDNAGFELAYVGSASAGRWRILRDAVSPWPTAAFFNVVVSPRQTAECLFGTMFEDGFEP